MSPSLLRYAALSAAFPMMLVATLSAAGSRRNSAKADAINMTVRIDADLDAASALPSSSEPATGDVQGTYDRSTHVLKFNARFFFLSGPATNARFHGPAAIDTVASATIASPRPEARLVKGSAWLSDEDERDLLAGRWYFNVTTAKHPQGEIRGTVHVHRAVDTSQTF